MNVSFPLCIRLALTLLYKQHSFDLSIKSRREVLTRYRLKVDIKTFIVIIV